MDKASQVDSRNSTISIVYAVFPNRESAEKLSQELVALKLVACANINSDHTAIYQWQGKLERASETAVYFKTQSDLVEKVISTIKASHPYELPAILAWQVQSALPEYERWVVSQTR